MCKLCAKIRFKGCRTKIIKRRDSKGVITNNNIIKIKFTQSFPCYLVEQSTGKNNRTNKFWAWEKEAFKNLQTTNQIIYVVYLFNISNIVACNKNLD